jgi:hypothetical protein
VIGRVYKLRGRWWRVLARWDSNVGRTNLCSRCGRWNEPCCGGLRKLLGVGPRNVLLERVEPNSWLVTHGQAAGVIGCDQPGLYFGVPEGAERMVRPFRGLRRA